MSVLKTGTVGRPAPHWLPSLFSTNQRLRNWGKTLDGLFFLAYRSSVEYGTSGNWTRKKKQSEQSEHKERGRWLAAVSFCLRRPTNQEPPRAAIGPLSFIKERSVPVSLENVWSSYPIQLRPVRTNNNNNNNNNNNSNSNSSQKKNENKQLDKPECVPLTFRYNHRVGWEGIQTGTKKNRKQKPNVDTAVISFGSESQFWGSLLFIFFVRSENKEKRRRWWWWSEWPEAGKGNRTRQSYWFKKKWLQFFFFINLSNHFQEPKWDRTIFFKFHFLFSSTTIFVFFFMFSKMADAILSSSKKNNKNSVEIN